MTKNMYTIAGVVILYHPDDDFIDNISRYQNDVGVVYAIDNSEEYSADRAEKLAKLKKVRYISNGENLGIASALNMAAQYAIQDGYDLLLTMDQDSKVTPGMLETMLACVAARDPRLEQVAIISPFHQYRSLQHTIINSPCEEILTTMTSGNLLNLNVYKVVGPFLHDLFIDSVDHEYCMRLVLKGFKTIRANHAILEHNLGNITEHRLIKKIYSGNHPPLRRYYGTRNKFYLYRQYKNTFPDHFRNFYKLIFFEILTILFFETSKYDKLKMIVRGYKDFRRGKYGKYSET